MPIRNRAKAISHEGNTNTKSHDGDITTKLHEGDITTKLHEGDNTTNEGDKTKSHERVITKKNRTEALPFGKQRSFQSL
jgi:hypothetical protein